jgi:hypothetical protein
MAYPDWVLAHKGKGMYVNKVNEDTYRIYRGHSERVKGTAKVRRVVDEYIGTITRDRGLIPTKAKIKGNVRTLCFGTYALLMWFCRTQIAGILHRQAKEGPAVVAAALLHVSYGYADAVSYENDWISVKFPGLSFPLPPALEKEGERVARAMRSTLHAALGAHVSTIIQASRHVHRVWVNGQWVNASVSETCKVLAHTHGFRWEVNA